MLKTGICSITFRQFNAAQIAAMVKKAGLDAIEWGGDIHVPPGDMDAASDVCKITQDAGLEISSYGSYYKVLDSEGAAQDFQPVLDSALALETETIRIWPGARSSGDADDQYWNRLVEETRRIAQQAEKRGIRLAFEFHSNTLTDTNESAQRLLQEIDRPNLFLCWQPMYWGPDMKTRLQGLQTLKDRILNFHVFHWKYDATREHWTDKIDRRPLKEGGADWSQYLSVTLPAGGHYALLEFVRNDDPAQFMEDAAVLKTWSQ